MQIELTEFDVTDRFEETNYEGLIFDCDGTLTDSMPLHFVAWRKTMAEYGIDFPEERFYSLGGMPSERIVDLLAGEKSMKLDAIEVAHRKEQAFIEMMDQLQPIKVVCQLARDNFGKRPISVASGGMRDIIKQQLLHIGMLDLFDIRVCSEDTERHKPEPDVFLEAARRMNVNPASCCVFEDSPLGFEAAAKAGMGFVDIRRWNQ